MRGKAGYEASIRILWLKLVHGVYTTDLVV